MAAHTLGRREKPLFLIWILYSLDDSIRSNVVYSTSNTTGHTSAHYTSYLPVDMTTISCRRRVLLMERLELSDVICIHYSRQTGK